MSITFYIKNKKKLFSYGKPLKVKETFKISEDEITQFGIDETEEDFNVKNFYNSELSEFECLILGVYGESSRGFELAYDKNSQFYSVRIYTPSTVTDWNIALRYMKALAKKMGSRIISEREEEYSYENIQNFPYEEDILFGLKSLFSIDDNKENSIIFGINRPVSFNETMKEKIMLSKTPIEDFEKIVKPLQYLDAFSANQKFYKNKKDGGILGTYTLTQNLDTILPYKPYVEFKNFEVVKQDEVSAWQISLVVIDGDENDFNSYHVLGNLDYEEFIKRLPKTSYEFLDGTYILVHALNREQMEELFYGKKN